MISYVQYFFYGLGSLVSNHYEEKLLDIVENHVKTRLTVENSIMSKLPK